jgi:alpha-L-fucosidase 2
MSYTRREFAAITAAAAASGLAEAQPPSTPVLWYKKPAEKWTDALPTGNGRLGAMVFGGVAEERLQLNEDTLWSGAGPKDWNNPDAKNHLAQVRRLVLEAKDYVAADAECRKMQGPYNESYQPLGNLRLKLEGLGEIGDYRRELNLHTAIATTTFKSGGFRYTREVFVSAPDQVVVVHTTTDNPAGLKLTASIDSPVQSESKTDPDGALRLIGKAPAHVDPNYHSGKNPIVYDPSEGKGMRFEVRVERNAETLLIAAKTGYRGPSNPPDLAAAAIADACRTHLATLRRKTYAQLRAAHVAEHQSLFRRVALELPKTDTDTSLDTGERLAAFPKTQDPSLAALYFHYGRYLLIASSRPGSQPANL